MSNESAMVNTFVPPWKGAKPRSPSAEYGPPTMVEVRPQLTQSLVDCDRPLGAPPGKPEQLLSRFALGIPNFADWQVRSPKERMWLKMRLKPKLTWLMVFGVKMWVSEMAALRP